LFPSKTTIRLNHPHCRVICERIAEYLENMRECTEIDRICVMDPSGILERSVLPPRQQPLDINGQHL